jgi:hypothetical protein
MPRALREVTPPGHPHYVPFPDHLITGLPPRRARMHGMGRIGSAVATTIEVAAAGKAAAAGTSAVLAAAGVGSAIVPVVGTIVGAVVGLVAGKLLDPNYLNVAQANAVEATYVQAFNQYRTIAGQAAGRTFGLSTMVAVWKGAVFAGLFPLNHNQGPQCFHEGCLALSGQPQWIDGTISGNGNATFPQAFAVMKNAIAAAVATVAPIGGTIASQNTLATAALVAAGSRSMAQLKGYGLGSMAPVRARYELQRRRNMRGLGRLGLAVTPGLAIANANVTTSGQAKAVPPPEAVSFIDTYWMPLQQRNSPAWGVPSSALEHQILYDVADAWLATQPITTTAFVAGVAANTYVQAPPAVVPAVAAVLPPATSSPTPPAPVVLPKLTATPQIISAAGTPTPAATTSSVKPTTTPVLAATATPLLPATPPAIAASAGTATTVAAATSANLDAAMAAQGFTRIGTSNAGFPIYQLQGTSNTYVYQNNQLIPYASVAQVAATGAVGTGVATPASGLDPNTASIIAAAVQQGMTAQQAADAAASNLTAQGVPVTPTVQAQLLDAAQNTTPNPTAPGIPVEWLVIGGGVLLAFLLMK